MEDQPAAGPGVSAVSGVQAQPMPAQLLKKKKTKKTKKTKKKNQQIY